MSLSLFVSDAARSHDLTDRFIFNDEERFEEGEDIFGDGDCFCDEDNLRAREGEGVEGEVKDSIVISLKYREMVPAMALIEPLYGDVAVFVAVDVDAPVVEVLRLSRSEVAAVAVLVGVVVSEATRGWRFLAQERRTASLRNSDSKRVGEKRVRRSRSD